MSPIDAIRAVCNTKDASILDKHEWADLRLGVYMLNRWTSMTNPHNAKMVNDFTNSIALSRCDDPARVFKMLSAVTTPFGKFKYIKKTTKEETKPKRQLSKQEEELGLSVREMELYDAYIESLGGEKHAKTA